MCCCMPEISPAMEMSYVCVAICDAWLELNFFFFFLFFQRELHTSYIILHIYIFYFYHLAWRCVMCAVDCTLALIIPGTLYAHSNRNGELIDVPRFGEEEVRAFRISVIATGIKVVALREIRPCELEEKYVIYISRATHNRYDVTCVGIRCRSFLDVFFLIFRQNFWRAQFKMFWTCPTIYITTKSASHYGKTNFTATDIFMNYNVCVKYHTSHHTQNVMLLLDCWLLWVKGASPKIPELSLHVISCFWFW